MFQGDSNRTSRLVLPPALSALMYPAAILTGAVRVPVCPNTKESHGCSIEFPAHSTINGSPTHLIRLLKISLHWFEHTFRTTCLTCMFSEKGKPERSEF